MSLRLASDAFQPAQRIPRDHSREGANLSPPLRFDGVPPGTQSLALIVDDPDAPRAEPFVHWLLWAIPPDTRALPSGLKKHAQLAEAGGAVQGTNDFREVGYDGPLPPPGHGVHHYHFRLYALSKPIDLNPKSDRKALQAALAGKILAEADLVGTYERPKGAK